MKLSILPIAYEIQDEKGDIVATVQRTATDNWVFHDLKKNWFEESPKKLKPSQLRREYKAIKKGKAKKAIYLTP